MGFLCLVPLPHASSCCGGAPGPLRQRGPPARPPCRRVLCEHRPHGGRLQLDGREAIDRHPVERKIVFFGRWGRGGRKVWNRNRKTVIDLVLLLAVAPPLVLYTPQVGSDPGLYAKFFVKLSAEALRKPFARLPVSPPAKTCATARPPERQARGRRPGEQREQEGGWWTSATGKLWREYESNCSLFPFRPQSFPRSPTSSPLSLSGPISAPPPCRSSPPIPVTSPPFGNCFQRRACPLRI